MQKECIKCNETKKIERFAPHSVNKKIIRNVCRDCYLEQAKNTRLKVNEEEYFKKLIDKKFVYKKCKLHGNLHHKDILLDIHKECKPVKIHLRCIQCMDENKQRKYNKENSDINFNNRLIECRRCKKEKYFYDFYFSELKRKSLVCSDCLRLGGLKYRQKISLKKKYNMTVEDYNMMLEKQNNVCAICFNPEIRIHRISNKVTNLSVDHCHKTGKIRGLLCRLCNIMLGNSLESKDILMSAIKYLEQHEET